MGGVGEFGLLKPDSTGTMKFVSLVDRVPQADRGFADVWRILPTPQGVYFSTYSRLLRLNNDGTIKDVAAAEEICQGILRSECALRVRQRTRD